MSVFPAISILEEFTMLLFTVLQLIVDVFWTGGRSIDDAFKTLQFIVELFSVLLSIVSPSIRSKFIRDTLKSHGTSIKRLAGVASLLNAIILSML